MLINSKCICAYVNAAAAAAAADGSRCTVANWSIFQMCRLPIAALLHVGSKRTSLNGSSNNGSCIITIIIIIVAVAVVAIVYHARMFAQPASTIAKEMTT